MTRTTARTAYLVITKDPSGYFMSHNLNASSAIEAERIARELHVVDEGWEYHQIELISMLKEIYT